MVLSPSFYRRDTRLVAQALLGCVLVHLTPGGKRVSGRIVETEAYLGIEDPAAHTFGDRRTQRTDAMYLLGGHSYVYFVYGMHFCFNVVTRNHGTPEAVLIRALEPLDGIEIMRKRRRVKSDHELTNGPAKLCQALSIDRSCNSLWLGDPPLFIERGRIPKSEIQVSPRIGVDYAGRASKWPLRYFNKHSPFVSQIKR